ncbi:MAG: VanZ family protein [Peptostreptococcaceae bacterium]|nr:VanZ family protein [Peptostreptococcaceae bacterium]
MKKFLCLLLVVFTMGSMYYFSGQDGVKSKYQSDSVVKIIDKIRDEITLKDERVISIKEKVFNKLKQYGNKGYVIRKIAHFTIYAAIGISISLFLYVITKKIFISSTLAFILSYMYAYYDELTRQVSVVGRTGTIKDVIIDSAGAFTGIAILFMVVVTFNGIRGFIRFVFRKSEA